jgi:hypothetical protein
MITSDDFYHRLELKVRQQLKSQRVAFLMGAGSAYLDGKGYPLSSQLWESIRGNIPDGQRADIQAKLDDGAKGVEQALDLLDNGGVNDTLHRHSITEAITTHFQTLAPPLDSHVQFLQCLARRADRTNTIFTLNYDPLLERAAEVGRVRLVDGFTGFEHSYFDPALFQEDSVVISRGYRGPQYRSVTGIIRLVKLHGSLGWYDCPSRGVRRCSFDAKIPTGTKRLMIPPQHRKATDTMMLPYAALWSEFRGMLRHGPHLMNRLVAIGYSMSDEHVNAVIENALARTDFTLMVFAKELAPEAFARWIPKTNVIIITNNRCSLYGEAGPGHTELWSFERLCKEV